MMLPCVCPAEHAVPGSAGRDAWLARDKAQHFLASFMLTGAVMTRLRIHEGWSRSDTRIAGAGITFGLGLTKEGRDLFKQAPYGRFSWKDLAADLVGIILGVFLLEWW